MYLKKGSNYSTHLLQFLVNFFWILPKLLVTRVFSIVPQIPQRPKRQTKTIPSPTLIPNCKDLDLDPRSLKVAKKGFIVEHCERSERCLLFML